MRVEGKIGQVVKTRAFYKGAYSTCAKVNTQHVATVEIRNILVTDDMTAVTGSLKIGWGCSSPTFLLLTYYKW